MFYTLCIIHYALCTMHCLVCSVFLWLICGGNHRNLGCVRLDLHILGQAHRKKTMFKDEHEAKKSGVHMLENNMALLHPELFNSDLFVFSSSEVVHFAVLFLHLCLMYEHALIKVAGSFWVFGKKQAFT